jgi:hypothetical protein
MRYFSYGLTVHEHEMHQACPRATLLGPGTLMSHEIRFAGTVDAVLDQYHSVEGMVWEIDECYIDMILAYERHDDKHLKMIRRGQDIMRAWTSYKRPGTPPQQPTWDYWQELESAHRQAKLPVSSLRRAIEVTEYYIDLNQNY